MKINIEPFYDNATNTISYILFDKIGGSAAIIDSVLDYDPRSGRIKTDSASRLIQFIKQHHLQLIWLLETHAHADHLSAAYYIKQQIGGEIAIGEHIINVQKTFKKLFNLGDDFVPDGSQFDYLLQDNETIILGDVRLTALHVPGHTPADMAYKVEDAIFVGDTLFMPDVGTARCDFPGGDVKSLYNSIQRIFTYPLATQLFMCHDYPPNREVKWQTTVAEQRQHNIHVNDTVSEQQFIDMRTKRDATLAMPVLIIPSIQVNIRAGELPPAENNGTHYLKIPLNVL